MLHMCIYRAPCDLILGHTRRLLQIGGTCGTPPPDTLQTPTSIAAISGPLETVFSNLYHLQEELCHNKAPSPAPPLCMFLARFPVYLYIELGACRK